MSKQSQTRGALLVHILMLLLVAMVVTWSMWQAPALLAGHSARKDLARLVEFDSAIRGGDFFPSWSSDLYAGYGSPIFQFYSPLAYYLTEIPVLMGFDYATALKVTWVLTLFASGLAMYYLGSTSLSRWAACLGGVFYMAAPYRFVDMFIRHALAEHCAFIWLPLIVGGTARFATKPGPMGFVVGAVAIAALILTHNVMALIGLPVCLAAALAFALSDSKSALTRVGSRLGRETKARINPTKGRRRSNRSLQFSPVAPAESRSNHHRTDDGRPNLVMVSFIRTGTVALVGIGLAAFFWWPAISGRALTYAERSLTGGYYDFHRHFVQGWQFFDTHWNFGISGGDTGKEIPLQFGLPHLLAAIGALVMVLAGWQGKGEAGRMRLVWSAVGLCVMAIGTFMCCRWSQPLWQWASLLKYVQFPWRFLSLVVFGSAMCATALGDRIEDITWHSQEERSPPHTRSPQRLLTHKGPVAIAFLIAGIMAAYFPYYSQAFFFTGDARTRSVVRVAAPEVHAMQSSGVLIPFGLSMSGTQLRAMNERATSGDDFLPRDVKEKPSHPPTEIVQAKGGRVIEVARLHQNYYRSRVEMSAAGKAELLQFWFPGWQATVDGIPAKTAPSGPQAIVSCDLPVGDHVVEFVYRNHPQRGIGTVVSLVSAAIGACAVAFLRQRRYRGQPVGIR